MREKRWVSIASSIKVAIRRGELYTGARIPSETEMATQWNVSPMTVHRAMSELQREGWVVRRCKIGTVVADRSARPITRIALVFTSLSEMPQGAYLSGIEESLAEGYQLLPLGTNHNARDEAQCLERAAGECSAMICYPTGAPENTALLKKIVAAMPVVFVDRIPEGIEADVVMTDNYGSILLGLQHLRADGHSRIAYFMEDQLHVSSVRDRLDGYLHFLKESGAADPDLWVRRFPSSMPWEQYYDRVETALIELLTEENPVTAIACQQDATMAAVLEACVHLNISVPAELAILSFNDTPSKMQPLSRRATRLMQRPVEMGNMVAKRIQNRLASTNLPIQPIRLMTDLYPATHYKPDGTTLEFLSKRSHR